MKKKNKQLKKRYYLINIEKEKEYILHIMVLNLV